jgi:hypothetical protein
MKIWGILLLVVIIGLAWLVLIYNLQHPEMMTNLAFISWIPVRWNSTYFGD